MLASRLIARNLRSPAGRRLVHQSARRSATHGAEDHGLTGAADNAFNRERLAVKQHAKDTTDFWRKLSLYVVIPCLIMGGANTWVQWKEHWVHQAHEPPIDKRPQYPYMNIRTKNFPKELIGGDGDQSLFWNPKYNYHKKDE